MKQSFPGRGAPFLLALLATGLALAGCGVGGGAGSDAPAEGAAALGPRAAAAPRSSAAAAQPGPALHPNAEKYRDAGGTPAVGRSGEAQLALRALLGRDGRTQLDATTGVLDAAAAPPAQLRQLQVKALDPAGGVLWTDLQQPGSGAVSLSYPGLARGTAVAAKANVGAPGGGRTEVVTATTTVLRRPDLAVTHLQAPPRIPAGQPVVVSATVQELNGDVGARASCALSIDGARADGMDAIWVDAGGTVTCAFSPTFTALGPHTLRVAVLGAVPADDNPANDALSAAVLVVPGNDFFDEATVYADTTPMSCTYAATTTYAGAITGSVASSGQVTSLVQWTALSGSAPVQLAFPLAFVVLGQSSGNAVLHAAAFSNQAPATASPGGAACLLLHGSDASGVTDFHLCSGTAAPAFGAPAPLTTLSYQRWAGQVTYHSQAYSNTFDARTGTAAVYSYNTFGTSSAGLPLPALGGSVDFNVAVVDATGRLLSAALTVPLTAFAYTSEQPLLCSTFAGDGFTATSCTQHRCQEQYLEGVASGVPGR